jgi:hypothetical protein
MDSRCFDDLVARLAVPLSRRRSFGLLGLWGFGHFSTPDDVIGKKRKGKKKKKKRSPQGAAACGACANPTPICANTTCVGCTSSTQCPAHTL